MKRIGSLHRTVRPQSGHRERQVDVVGTAAVPVQPGAVDEPRVVRVVAEGIAFPRRQFGDVAHPPRELHAEVAVQRRPRRIDRRLDVVHLAIDFAGRRRVTGEIHSGGEVGAARLQRELRAFTPEIVPEAEHRLLGHMRLFRAELLPVEDRAAGAPGLHAEAESVRQPEVIESHVGEVPLRLPPEEGAERGSLRNSLRKPGVGVFIGVQRGVTADEGLAAETEAAADLRMTPVFEVGDRELRPGVEGRPHPEPFAVHLPEKSTKNIDHPLEIPVGELRRILHIIPRMSVYGLLFARQSRGFSVRIGDADPFAPLEAILHLPVVFENFRTVRGPEHQRNFFCILNQGPPL